MGTKKGVILAGGKGTRMLPATRVINKHMIPVLNKPLILYPLETLKTFGVEDILIVSGGNHLGDIAEFLGDGSEYGVNLTYKVQSEAGGIAQALGLAESFAGGDEVMVILGDNVFGDMQRDLSYKYNQPGISDGATIFLRKVPDPERFGVPVFEGVEGEDWSTLRISKIEEKPEHPQSEYAVTGLYLYPNEVFEVVKTLKPSARGELEITDVNNYFIEKGKMSFVRLDNTFWSDAGTPESMYNTIQFIKEKM